MRTITILELEEKFSHLEFHADDMRIFSLFINNAMDPMIETKDLFVRWLQKYGVFPLQMYITTYDDMDIASELRAKNVTFEKERVKTQLIFNIHISNQDEIESTVGEFFCMSSHSEIMFIASDEVEVSTCDSIHRASAVIPNDAFVMIIEHDGQGIQLLTTKKEWFTEEGLLAMMKGIEHIGYEAKFYGLSKGNS